MKNKYLNTLIDQHLLPFVEKPARYIGHEHHIVQKTFEQIDLHVAIAFPEVYEIAMSSQAVNILYHQLNKRGTIWAERVFAPWLDAEKIMRTKKIPLFSLDSFTPLREFDIIGFTLQYELTYTNILNMLDLAGIPLRTQERREDDPLILGGGPCTCNPEPMADFFDVFYIGDAENGLIEFCQTIIQAKKQGLSREETLFAVSGQRGVYIPSLYKAEYDTAGNFSGLQALHPKAPDKIRTQIVSELKEDHYPEKPLVPLIEVTHDRLAVEVMRGCTEGCRYCNAGMIYRPVRERDPDEVLDFTLRALDATGYDEVSFLSLSISDYSGLSALMKKERQALSGKEVNFSFPSMRLDGFRQEIADFARTVRKSGFTFAPEAGSDRLRQVINKNISDDDLLQAVKIAIDNGWKTLKFYFMIGLPTETEEDIEAIADLIERVLKGSKGSGRIRLNVSVSPHSPKAHTPFQWEKQSTEEEFRQKISLLKNRLFRYKQVKLSWREPSVSKIECILGRGDRRLGDVIFETWKNGARFDGWTDQFDNKLWESTFIKKNIPINRHLDQLPVSASLPWDHIDKGIRKSYLIKERENALRGKTTLDCKDFKCYGCGIQRVREFGELTRCYLPEQKKYKPDLRKTVAAGERTADQESTGPKSGNIRHVRVQYRKVGYSKYLSHFDVVRAFERACRRAAIKIVHSQGFNPRPKISFSSPLRLGYSSEAEFADLQIIDLSSQDLPGRLNPYLPQGISITDVVSIPAAHRSLSASINASEYQILLDKQQVNQVRINEMMDNVPVLVQRRTKGVEKTINIRPFIESIKKGKRTLSVHTAIINGRTVRIDEILSHLITTVNTDVRSFPVHRKRQLVKSDGKSFSPMELF